MTAPQINSVTGKLTMCLSVIALFAVLSGYAQPPQTDEGPAAHIFQLSITLLLLTVAIFLATAEWRQPLKSLRPLVFPAIASILAFGALYYLEHYR